MEFAVIGLIVTTVPNDETARAIAAQLLDERAAACVTVIPGARSLYWWKGTIESAEEVVLVAKTRADAVERVADRVRALHPYDLPEVVIDANVRASGAYAAWIAEEVAPCDGPSSR